MITGLKAVAAALSLLFFLSGEALSYDIKDTNSNTVVTDHAGRRILVKSPFKRIISLYGAHTENLFSLGLDSEILGVGRNENYPPRAKKKPAFSYHDGPEKFIAARPDLILIRPMIDKGYAKLISRLEKSGITVASFQPKRMDKMILYFKALGVLTGKRRQAEDAIECFLKKIEGFKRLSAMIKKKKRVYFEAIHGKMKTFSPGAMPMEVLEIAGGINVASDASPVRGTNIAYYGKERILAKAGIIDVYLAQRGTMNRPTIDTIRKEPGFSAIKAVKEGQVFILDETIVSRPTLRIIHGIARIGRILYPEIFTEKRVERIISDQEGPCEGYSNSGH